MKKFDELLQTIRKLRSPGGCPWDRAQTVNDMKRYLLEEAYELADAVESGSVSGLKEELGDIYLILTVISEMHREKGLFDHGDVFSEVNKKLVSRHPHVFSSKKLKTKEEVLSHWIKDKAKKKKRSSVKCRLPLSAPALILAELLFKELTHLNENGEAIFDKKALSEDIFKKAGDLNRNINKAKKIKAAKKSADSPAVRMDEIAGKENFEDKICSLLMGIVRLGYSCGIELESALRAKVLEEAQNTTYK